MRTTDKRTCGQGTKSSYPSLKLGSDKHQSALTQIDITRHPRRKLGSDAHQSVLTQIDITRHPRRKLGSDKHQSVLTQIDITSLFNSYQVQPLSPPSP